MAGITPLNLHASTTPDEPAAALVLEAFVDTLIPADATPAASTLGVDLEILESSRADLAYVHLIHLGCRWLNHQSGGDFTRLPEADRIPILRWMEQADRRTLPALFFNRIRHQAMAIYYSKPPSWKGLGLNHPPQPLGYMDYRS